MDLYLCCDSCCFICISRNIDGELGYKKGSVKD